MSDALANKGIDLSRLKRRPVDLTTVKKPRFLFHGWQMFNDIGDVVTDEATWNRDRFMKSAYLPGVHWLRVEPFEKNDGMVFWMLSGPDIVKDEHAVYFGRFLKFEEIVHAAEAYILRARDQGQRIFDIQARQRWEWELNVDKLIAGWKGVPLPA